MSRLLYMPPGPSSTYIDRAEFTAKGAGIVFGVIFTPIMAGPAYLLGARGLWLLLGALLGGIVAGVVAWRLSLAVANGAGAAFLSFVQPSGNSTPYETQFSQGLALEAADNIAGALEWFDRAVADRPADPRVRVVAAEVNGRAGQHRRSESLFLEARRLTTDRATELYTTQRIIDLRLGPLDEPERACTELRRVVDRFAGTPEAEGARAAIERLKREQRGA
jgi:hypothetical protein